MPQSSPLKRLLLKPLLLPKVAEILAALSGTCAVIFMLHRFASPERGVQGIDPEKVRAILAQLRKRRYEFISVHEVFRRLRQSEPLKRAVAFTIDDGYFDQAQVASSVFAELDCPATIFVSTGYLDGQMWYWWDQLEYIVERTKRPEITARIGKLERSYRLDSHDARRAAILAINRECENASNAARLACIADLSREAEVELPSRPPARYEPLSWSEARRLEKKGIGFGPHTVTHPVLSSTSAEHSEFEITESWRRLSAEVSHPVPVFCYPNGRERDYGEREISVISRLGFWGALTGRPASVAPESFRQPPAIFRVPRYPCGDYLPDILQCVSGLETIKAKIRGEIA